MNLNHITPARLSQLYRKVYIVCMFTITMLKFDRLHIWMMHKHLCTGKDSHNIKK